MAESSSVSPQSGGTATAKMRFGVFNQPMPYVGLTVRQARTKLGGQWQVPADATAHIGKTQLDDDYVIQEGDQIEFQRLTGEKGTD